MSSLILDAGALVAFDKGDARVRALFTASARRGLDLVTPSPVIGQVWRDGRKQALLAKLLPAIDVVAPDEAAARRAGELLAKTRTSDVVDALVVGLSRDGDRILTSDPEDMERLVEAAGVRVVILAV